jgi:hypothetical protein
MERVYILMAIVALFVSCGQRQAKTANESEVSTSTIDMLQVDTLQDMPPFEVSLKNEENNMVTEEEFIKIIKDNVPSLVSTFSATDTIDYGYDCENTPINFLGRLSKLSVFPKDFSIRLYDYCSYIVKIEDTKLNGFPLLIKLEYAGGGYKSLIFALYNAEGKEINSTILVTNSFHLLPTSYDAIDEQLTNKGWTYTFSNDTIDMTVYSSYNSDFRDNTAIKDTDAQKEHRIFHILVNGKVELIEKEKL